MRRFCWLILIFVLAAAARGQQYTTGFENPPYVASTAGFPLTGQDGWITPIPSGSQYTVHPYAPNAFGFQPNPAGQVQFTAGLCNGGTALARAQHPVNFASNDTWTATWDMAAKYMGAPPAANSIGSFSLQDSAAARSFTVLGTWTNVITPNLWNAGFLVYDAAGAPAPPPGLFPGPQWQNLQTNHWYRLSATFSFSQNRILEVSITDLHTLATVRVEPTGWFLLGGASPSQPLPTAIRLTTAGSIPGNVLGWDNIDACPFQVTGFNPPAGPEGTIVQITGCGFGTDPAALSVLVAGATGEGVPLTVLSTTDTLITARLGPVPADAAPGRIRVIRGTGGLKLLIPTLDDVIPEEPLGTQVWDRLGDTRTAQSLTQFTPLVTSPPTGTQWFFGQNISGQMQVLVAPDPGHPQPNTTLRIIAKLHNQVLAIGSDLEATNVRLRVGGSTQYLADRICDVIQSAFSAHNINTTCVITPAGSNRLITLTLRDPLNNIVPVDSGILEVVVVDPIRITPFAIGPVTAFYHAGLTNQSGAALVQPVDLTGNDGATISPNVPVTGGLRIDTDLIPLALPNTSFTTRAWGVLAGQPNELIGTARLQRSGTLIDALADFSPIGASQVRVDIYYNTALKATALVPAGSVAHLTAGALGQPRVTGCGGRPTMGVNAPFLWIDLDRPCLITPTGGSTVIGNQVRVTAGSGAGNVQNFQAFDVASGQDSPLDADAFVIFSSVEGGICYANCDGSTAPPPLNVLDFACFLNQFAAGDLAANCDGSLTPPEVNVLDFSCFLNSFAAGCP